MKGTLDRALKKTETQADPDRAAVGVAAQGIALAASLMAREFTLVATNVPYLARGKQDETLRDYLDDVHPAAKADLATAFVERCLEYLRRGWIDGSRDAAELAVPRVVQGASRVDAAAGDVERGGEAR